MADIRRFAAINAKIKALESLLLEKKDYEQLISMKESEEIIRYLKGTKGYGQLLGNVADDVDINHVQHLFKVDIIEKYERMSYYYTDVYKKFYKTLFMRFEIEDIKLYLRAFLRNEPIQHFQTHLLRTKYHQIDFKILSQATSLGSFVEGLKETPYHNLLKYYLEEDPEKMMFYMEMRLDHYYFKTLYKGIEAFSKEDYLLMAESLGKNIDVQNLQWIFRGLKYYQLSSEELLNYTLNMGYYLKYKDLKQLCYTKDMALLIQCIKETKYSDLFTGHEQDEIFFELNMERYLIQLMMEQKRRHPMSIMDTIVYMHRKEYEVRDMFTLLESKRYHAPIEDVKRFLVYNTG